MPADQHLAAAVILYSSGDGASDELDRTRQVERAVEARSAYDVAGSILL